MKPDPEFAHQAILNAHQALLRGDRQAARDWSMRAVELDPCSEEPWLYLAAVSNPSDSIRCLEQALSINPQSQRAHKGMLWAQERLKSEQAEKRIETSNQSILKPVEIAAQGEDFQKVSSQFASTEPKTMPRLPEASAQRSAHLTVSEAKNHTKIVNEARWTRSLKRFSSHWQNWIGFVLVSLFILVAVTAPLISPNNTKSPGPFMRVAGYRRSDMEPHLPSAAALLGTLPGQFDVFHALVWGTRGALTFGLEVVILAAAFGLLVGAIAGYAGGLVSSILMRITDAFLAFPIIAGVVFLSQLWNMSIVSMGGMWDRFSNVWVPNPEATLSPIQVLLQAINPLMLTLIIFSWMPYARLTNAVVTTLKQSDFIQAARAIGARPSRIIFRHLLPNSVTPSIVLAARDVGSMVILQATFTFINLGGSSTWGEILVMGKDWVLGPGGGILKYWWVYVPATLALVLFGIGWNLLGDGLGEFLDPHEV